MGSHPNHVSKLQVESDWVKKVMSVICYLSFITWLRHVAEACGWSYEWSQLEVICQRGCQVMSIVYHVGEACGWSVCEVSMYPRGQWLTSALYWLTHHMIVRHQIRGRGGRRKGNRGVGPRMHVLVSAQWLFYRYLLIYKMCLEELMHVQVCVASCVRSGSCDSWTYTTKYPWGGFNLLLPNMLTPPVYDSVYQHVTPTCSLQPVFMGWFQ